jgi:hypothetical protein
MVIVFMFVEIVVMMKTITGGFVRIVLLRGPALGPSFGGTACPAGGSAPWQAQAASMRAARHRREISDDETSDAGCEHDVCRRSEGAGLGPPERRQGIPGGERVRGGHHSMELRHDIGIDIGIVQGVQVPGRPKAGDRDPGLPVLEGKASVASHRVRAARAEIQREARRGLVRGHRGWPG